MQAFLERKNLAVHGLIYTFFFAIRILPFTSLAINSIKKAPVILIRFLLAATIFLLTGIRFYIQIINHKNKFLVSFRILLLSNMFTVALQYLFNIFTLVETISHLKFNSTKSGQKKSIFKMLEEVQKNWNFFSKNLW